MGRPKSIQQVKECGKCHKKFMTGYDIREIIDDHHAAFYSAKAKHPLAVGDWICHLCGKVRECATCSNRPHNFKAAPTVIQREAVRVELSYYLNVPLILNVKVCQPCRQRASDIKRKQQAAAFLELNGGHQQAEDRANHAADDITNNCMVQLFPSPAPVPVEENAHQEQDGGYAEEEEEEPVASHNQDNENNDEHNSNNDNSELLPPNSSPRPHGGDDHHCRRSRRRNITSGNRKQRQRRVSQNEPSTSASHTRKKIKLSVDSTDGTTEQSSADPSSNSDDAYVDPSDKLVNYPARQAIRSKRTCFRCGIQENLSVISLSVRRHAFNAANYFIPRMNVMCPKCSISVTTTVKEFKRFPWRKARSDITVDDLKLLLFTTPQVRIWDQMYCLNIDSDRLRVITGLNKEHFADFVSQLLKLRNSRVRNINQAVFVFLYKMRTGLSNEHISAIYGLPGPSSVSETFASVLEAFTENPDIDFGPRKCSRAKLLENTSNLARKLLNLRDDQLALVLDGTYIRHQKSTNHKFQRFEYSGQKHTYLCKPFTITTTNGFIVDFAGPFGGKESDGTIVKMVLTRTRMKKILRKGDILIVDRGFSRSKEFMESLDYIVLMPAMLNKRDQLPTLEANASRTVTKLRWVVEAVHGHLWGRWKLLKNTVDYKMLPKVEAMCKVIGFIHNHYGTRLAIEDENTNEIIDRMKKRSNVENKLKELIKEKRWNTHPSTLKPIDVDQLTDFPRLSEKQLLLFTSGPYQLGLAKSYLAEIMDDNNKILLRFTNFARTIIRVDLRSRHTSEKKYRVYIRYEPKNNTADGIEAYYCECKSGARTVGCCAHVATVVAYLSNLRWLSTIRRPAKQFDYLFINPYSDSEDDDEDIQAAINAQEQVSSNHDNDITDDDNHDGQDDMIEESDQDDDP